MRTTRLEEVTRVEEWAIKRGLLKESNDTKAQTLKLMEEVGELAHAIAYRDGVGIIDSIGDCAVVLIILAAQYGLTFEQCLDHAWDEIKDRTCKLEDGLFKKD